jgi:hypothetical protein
VYQRKQERSRRVIGLTPGLAIEFENVKTRVTYSVIGSLDLGDIHVVGGGANFFVLLSGEDINTNHMHLSVTVLSGLGSGGFHNLAWSSLHHSMTTLLDSRALHGEGLGGTTSHALESLGFLLRHCVRLEWYLPKLKKGGINSKEMIEDEIEKKKKKGEGK